MTKKEKFYKIIESNRRYLDELGVISIDIFGSVVRGEDSKYSDYDILVEFRKEKKSFKSFTALCDLLENYLGENYELITKESLSPYIGPYILKKIKMPKLPLEYLKHILEETEFIIGELNRTSEDDFYINPILKRAFVRSLEIIGEAAKNIPQDFKERHCDVDWKNMARMRDKLIHHYFGIDYSIVWDVVKNEVPVLHSKILKIIQSEEKER